MQIPRADRRTLFIFPAFISLVVGGSLLVYGIEKFSALKFVAAALIPFALVRIVRVATPLWLMILLSYVTLIAAIVDADWLLEASGFR